MRSLKYRKVKSGEAGLAFRVRPALPQSSHLYLLPGYVPSRAAWMGVPSSAAWVGVGSRTGPGWVLVAELALGGCGSSAV